MVNLYLDPWQEEVLKTEGNICLRSGRQVGKSTVISVLAGDYAVNNRNKQILVIASVERQAYELFSKILAYMEQKHRNLIKTGKDRPTKTKLQLKNGTKILCLPTGLTGHGIRGYTIDLLIADEAAFIPREVWDAVTPMIATRIKDGARMVLLSTPFGRDNYFFDCFNDSSFTKFHVSSEDCPRIDKGFLEREKLRKSKMAYAQEYLGEFADGDMQFFPDDLIKACMKLSRTPIKPGSNYYLGSDIARLGEDDSTFEILELIDDKLYHRENISTSKTYLNQTTDFIRKLDNKYNFQKIFIDSEGLGIAVYDFLLADDQTRRKIVGVKNSTKIDDRDYNKPRTIMKEELYTNLLALMQKKEIYLLDDEEIYFALRSVMFEYTQDSLGRAQLHIWGRYEMGGKRDHIVEGLIRAALAIKYKALNIWLSSFKL